MTARILRFPTATCMLCGALYDYRNNHADVCRVAESQRRHPSNRCHRPNPGDGAA